MKCHFNMQIDGGVVILIDLTTGVSVTNAADEVVKEVVFVMGTDSGFRIIYRDTMGGFDGLAHRGERFIGFVPLNTHDRNVAVDLARRGVNCAGHPWPT